MPIIFGHGEASQKLPAFAISSADKKTQLAVMLRPDEAQLIAKTLAKAAEAAVILMIEEAQQ
ncbi:hypothetical protein [Roseovarius sp. D0-M9]|uniref:hypothetical protein n=1 Tax=Roseovarius sp. D0-M9 TaxID=3127117 RepID=UPI00300F8567